MKNALNFNIDFDSIFNDKDISNMAVQSKAMKSVIKNDKINTLKAKSLSDLCIKPKHGEQYRIITEKQFNAYAFILYILQTETIEELNISIFRINEPTVNSIIELIEQGKIKSANFVISNFFNQTKKPEKWAITLKDYCDTKKNCKYVYVHNHSKVALIKTKKNYYVFEGSGNMSDNATIEQYLFENCKKTYNFHKGWISELVKTDKKST